MIFLQQQQQMSGQRNNLLNSMPLPLSMLRQFAQAQDNDDPEFEEEEEEEDSTPPS